MRLPKRRSKIICTLGPSSKGLENISALITAGMDVARLNFSHGTLEQHAENIQNIRAASKKLQIPVAILGDLQGPKIRTGKIIGAEKLGLPLKKGQELNFEGCEKTSDKGAGDGSATQPLFISYARLGADLVPGDLVLFDDGLVRMRVLKNNLEKNQILVVVEHGEYLGENKGVNMPGAKLSTLGVTEKDWADIQFAVEQNVDFLALSFVRTAREVKSLKQFLDQKKTGIQVIAKIEMAEAIKNIDSILEQTDGIMVARGDLGVEIGNEKVPIVQKQLIQKARRVGKPVITATQMLMSMVQNPTPSRAEASDVANAVLDGTDALMLSNETASGAYPTLSVSTMAEIILGAEGFFQKNDLFTNVLQGSAETNLPKLPISEAIEAAATALANSLGAKCLACLTRSGQAARQLSKYRPSVPIFAFAENEKVQAQLCLSWGVSVISWKEIGAKDYTLFDELLKELSRLGLMTTGDLSIMTAGIPTTLRVGTTNTIVVKPFKEPFDP